MAELASGKALKMIELQRKDLEKYALRQWPKLHLSAAGRNLRQRAKK